MSQAPSWRDRVHDIHPQAHQTMMNYIGTLVSDPAIPDMYKELISLASATTIRYRPSMENHARRALAAGATRDQLFLAMSLAALAGGIPCLVEATEVLAAVELQVAQER